MACARVIVDGSRWAAAAAWSAPAASAVTAAAVAGSDVQSLISWKKLSAGSMSLQTMASPINIAKTTVVFRSWRVCALIAATLTSCSSAMDCASALPSVAPWPSPAAVGFFADAFSASSACAARFLRRCSRSSRLCAMKSPRRSADRPTKTRSSSHVVSHTRCSTWLAE